MSRWTLVQLDLQTARGLPRHESNVYLVLFWGALPLGARSFLPEETPLRHDQLLALASGWMATQASIRGPDGRGFVQASFDGKPLKQGPRALPDSMGPVMQMLDAQAAFQPCDASALSVIVCTRDRPQALAGSLQSLLAQHCPAGEVLVVDNSGSGSAREVCDRFASVRYVHEPRPGLSVARNRGLAEARGEFLAFTDDDVEASRGWTAELLRAFEASGADAVTGLVLPATLDDPAQQSFQFEMGAFGASYQPCEFGDLFFSRNRSRGVQVWRVGAGANMAFRRRVFEGIGGFDERLGAGASGCSEDSELWYRLLANGGRCYYEPRAVVGHHHRGDWDALVSQIRAYLRGHASALIVQYDHSGDRGNLRRLFLQLPRYLLRTLLRSLLQGRGIRLRLAWAELRGWIDALHYWRRPGWRTRS